MNISCDKLSDHVDDHVDDHASVSNSSQRTYNKIGEL